MTTIFRYALRSLLHRPFVAIVLCAGLAVAIALPIAINWTAQQADQALRARAEGIPLVLGAAGSANDLVFHALEFSNAPPGPIHVAEWELLAGFKRAETAPLLIDATARGVPLIGTDGNYFRLRQLRLAHGEPLAQLGDAIIGARVANQLDLRPGDQLATDVDELFALSGNLPVQLNIVGILASAGSADDMAIFVNLDTAWLIGGIGHAHERAPAAREGSDSPISGSAAEGVIVITPENIDSFHFHGARARYPLTAVLAQPHSEQDRLWLVGHFIDNPNGIQLAEADRVMNALLERALRIKSVLESVVFISLISTIALAIALIWLTVRLRRGEFRTMSRIGLSRPRIALIAGTELSLLIAAALTLALLMAFVLQWWGTQIFSRLIY